MVSDLIFSLLITIAIVAVVVGFVFLFMWKAVVAGSILSFIILWAFVHLIVMDA